MAGLKPGRKPKLNKELTRQLILLASNGVPKEIACAVVGIESRTLRLWLEKGRAGDKRFSNLERDLEQAEAKAQSSMLMQIRKAGGRDWKAIAWLLERCFSEKFGYRAQTKVQVEADLERILDVVENTLGGDAAARVFAAIAGEAGSAPSRETPSETGPVH